jgi:hypothetical protein
VVIVGAAVIAAMAKLDVWAGAAAAVLVLAGVVRWLRG